MLAEVTRTYGGLEGARVKAGTRFGVGKDYPGLRTITLGRYKQLQGQRLVKEVDGAGQAAPGATANLEPQGKPDRTPRRGAEAPPPNKKEPDSQPPARSRVRARSRKRTQEEAPPEPRPLVRQQPGGHAGQAPASSSSPEVRQSGSVTLKQRGNRRKAPTSAGSPSTTPVSLQKGPGSTTSSRGSRGGRTSYTPATDDGGEPSKESPSSEVFD